MNEFTEIERVARQFEQLLSKLHEDGVITEHQKLSIAPPETANMIVPQLWEAGIDDVGIAQTLHSIFNTDVFNGQVKDPESLLRSDVDKCPWLISDGTLYVTNPYDRNQIEPLIRRKKTEGGKLAFTAMGILPLSAIELSIVASAETDVSTQLSNDESVQWADNFVDSLLKDSIARQASDIHINPDIRGGMIRYRIDGRCLLPRRGELRYIDKDNYKLVCNNIMERTSKQNNYLEPCSGYMNFTAGHKEIAIRMEMAPVKVGTSSSPKITLRILNNNRKVSYLSSLGLSEKQSESIRQLGHRPNGIVVITGPTGSGKSTTLKAVLRDVRDTYPEKTIFSIEDPVEEQIDGVTSLEVTQHMSFPNALRSLLRHDPDVIMVGEIRDAETAELAIRASMTGHLVLTTLHTNDAHSAINRLRDLGIPNSLIAENVLAVTAQRLVPVVCHTCSEEIHISEDPKLFSTYSNIAKLAQPDTKVRKLIHDKGCPRCNRGYSGRNLVNEIFTIDDQVQSQITEGYSGHAIKKIQIKQHTFDDIWEDGIRLASEGITTLDKLEELLSPIETVRQDSEAKIEALFKTKHQQSNQLKKGVAKPSANAILNT